MDPSKDRIGLDSVAHVMADLLAGMDAEEVLIWCRPVRGGAELVSRAGRPAAGPLPMPELESGFAGTRFTDQGHLVVAALDACDGQLVIAARRQAPFAQRDAQALRAVLHALVASRI